MNREEVEKVARAAADKFIDGLSNALTVTETETGEWRVRLSVVDGDQKHGIDRWISKVGIELAYAPQALLAVDVEIMVLDFWRGVPSLDELVLVARAVVAMGESIARAAKRVPS